MGLPKVKQPLFELTVPSTQEKELFRPYLGGEEKILLIAKESGDTKDIIMSLKQVIQNCSQSENFDADELATFDIEYLFLKLRAKSVDNIVKVAYMDDEEEAAATGEEEIEPHTFNIDLNEVEMLQRPETSNIIEINETDGIVMKYPSMKEIENMPEFGNMGEEFSYLIRCCIKNIYDETTVYPVNEYTVEDLNDYIDSLPIPVLTKIKNFFQTMPKMHHVIKYTNKLGTPRTIELKSLSDFFTLR
jgi:hypothetical protein